MYIALLYNTSQSEKLFLTRCSSYLTVSCIILCILTALFIRPIGICWYNLHICIVMLYITLQSITFGKELFCYSISFPSWCKYSESITMNHVRDHPLFIKIRRIILPISVHCKICKSISPSLHASCFISCQPNKNRCCC